MSKISYIIPSMNRPTLHRTLDSIKPWADDEILVEFDIPASGWWGNPQRNRAIVRATGDYLAFMDDDDYYVPEARLIIERAILKNPEKPLLFQIQYPNGEVLWKTKEVVAGNISSQMIVIPNDPTKFTRWFERPNMADFMFVRDWKWSEIAWIEQVICQMAHN